MSIQWIARIVIAALLITGTAAAVPGVSEYGAQPQPTDSGAAVVTTLTAEEAVTAALEHAGLTAGQVTGLHSEYDGDDRTPEWDIEFRSGDWEYDYTVHAQTGAVTEWDKEFDPPKKEEPVPTELAPVEPAPTEPAAKLLTAEEAVAAALEHAGLTAQQVKGLSTDFDTDDGQTEWEVEFYAGGWEYEYEIDAETGKILHREKERDD